MTIYRAMGPIQLLTHAMGLRHTFVMLTQGIHCELRIGVAIVPGDMLMNQHVPRFHKAQCIKGSIYLFSRNGSLHSSVRPSEILYLPLQTPSPCACDLRSPSVDSEPQ